MSRKLMLISGLLLSLAASGVYAGKDLYLHSHKGTPAQAQNQDTNFGSPASYDRGNLYRHNYQLQLSAAGVDLPKKLSVEKRAVANFDVRNNADKDLVLVIGDDKAIKEMAELFAAGKTEQPFNFHTIQVKAGESAQFAWRFDTYATRQVKLSVMDNQGHLAAKVLKVNVGPREDRNAQLAGQ